MPGTAPSGSAEVTAVSSWLKGYNVEVDGFQIGTEGTGSDAGGSYTANIDIPGRVVPSG